MRLHYPCAKPMSAPQPTSPARRRLLGAVAPVALPILLVVGLWLGGHPEDLPGFLRSAFVANPQTQVVDEAIERIAHDYYRPIPTRKLSSASIAGVVASLDDRFSHYLTPGEYREFISPPHFTGIGVDVAARARRQPRAADRARVRLLAGRRARD